MGGSIGTSAEVYAKVICMRMVATKEKNQTNGRKRRRGGIEKRKKKEKKKEKEKKRRRRNKKRKWGEKSESANK